MTKFIASRVLGVGLLCLISLTGCGVFVDGREDAGSFQNYAAGDVNVWYTPRDHVVTISTGGSGNCHGYAWSTTCGWPDSWMYNLPSPNEFISDGSFVLVDSAEDASGIPSGVKVGDKAYYGGPGLPLHSAVVSGLPNPNVPGDKGRVTSYTIRAPGPVEVPPDQTGYNGTIYYYRPAKPEYCSSRPSENKRMFVNGKITVTVPRAAWTYTAAVSGAGPWRFRWYAGVGSGWYEKRETAMTSSWDTRAFLSQHPEASQMSLNLYVTDQYGRNGVMLGNFDTRYRTDTGR